MGVLLVELFRWPVIAYDTDLWYHLDDGRYFFTHHTISSTTFFSFVQPLYTWINYSWLFQVLLYPLYLHTGYYGLIALRTALYAATVWLIVRFVLMKGQAPLETRPLGVAVCVLAALLLLARGIQLRPHLFSYLGVILCLLILEHHRDRALWLVPLAILWCNLHGITFPVMLLVLGAYLLEYFLARAAGRPSSSAEQWRVLVPMGLAAMAVFCTPYGGRLLQVPFRPLGNQAQFLKELRPVTWPELFNVEIKNFLPSYHTLLFAYLVIMVAALVTVWARKRLRISHLCLVAGAGILFWQGVRFTAELVLLSLPLIRTALPEWSARLCRRRLTPTGAVLLIMVMVSPFTLIRAQFQNRPRYPLSSAELPQGVAAFLQSLRVGGTVLNHPNSGGYLRWALFPDYKIFMHMHFIFPDELFYTGLQAFAQEPVLRRVVETYHPSFISAPISDGYMPKLMSAFPEYAPVFFDDVEVLYANRQRHPEIVTRYRLTALDPFALELGGIATMLRYPEFDRVAQEAKRLLTSNPDCLVINHLLAAAYNEARAFDRALPFAETIIRAYPNATTGYGLRGDALMGLGAFPQAIQSYQAALRKRGKSPASRLELYTQMARAYAAWGRPRQAYETFQRAIRPFGSEATIQDVYEFGLAAAAIGKYREAATLFRLDLQRIPLEQSEWIQRVNEALARISRLQPDTVRR